MVQTFGDRANFHPHVHALVTRGGWDASGEWVPVPYVDEGSAEELFRHKVLAVLRRRGLLSLERIELLLSWRRSGFSVHTRVHAHPGEGRDFETLVRYMMRSPVSLTRLRFTPGAKEVVYARKGGHDAYVQQLVDVVRKNQPHALVSGRAGHGLGDYDTLGDMEVPPRNVEGPWESVDTTNDSWAHAWYDENWKTPKEILHRLIASVGRGGTYMLP